MSLLVLFASLLIQDPDVDALLKQLSDESIEVREKASVLLMELGPKIEERLKAEALTAQGEPKSRIEVILGAIARRRMIEVVMPPVRPVSLEATDRPLKEVLEEFSAKSGFSLKVGDTGAKLVTVRLRGAPPVEALDAICRAARVGYGCPRSPDFSIDASRQPADIWVEGRYSEVPRAFAGRFGVYAASLGVTRSTDFDGATGSTNLVLGAFWPAEVRPRARPFLEITSAIDDRGASLLERDKAAPTQAVSLPELRGIPLYRSTSRAWLKGPSPGASRIASLKGRIKTRFFVQHYLVFDSPAGDRKLTYDGVVLELKDFTHAGDDVRFKLEISGFRRPTGQAESRWTFNGRMRVDADMIVLKADGDLEHRPSEGTSGPTETGWRCNYYFKGVQSQVSAIRIEVDGVMIDDVVDFELKDIPLQ